MNWLKGTMANIAGTQEPIYGPSAIQSCATQSPSHTVLTKKDLAWAGQRSTCVETQTFYITAASGHIAMAQVIYSNVAGIHTTCQFNSKIFYPAGSEKPNLWESHPLSNQRFDKDKTSFLADKCSVDMSADGESYHIKSSTSSKCLVDITFKRAVPGFVAGKNGTSTFGTDPQNPWGSMRHAFWPRCTVSGSFITQEGPIDMAGVGCFIHALQGMKPHHAAARWNFCNWQSDKHSAVLMSYITPPSYGSTVVAVGAVTSTTDLLFAGSHGVSAEHSVVKGDSDVDWPEPGAVVFRWDGKDPTGSEFFAEVAGDLGTRTDRVDVMAEVPKFVKQIVAGAAGTRPYIYQYTPKLPLKMSGHEKLAAEDGQLFMEATFIS